MGERTNERTNDGKFNIDRSKKFWVKKFLTAPSPNFFLTARPLPKNLDARSPQKKRFFLFLIFFADFHFHFDFWGPKIFLVSKKKLKKNVFFKKVKKKLQHSNLYRTKKKIAH